MSNTYPPPHPLFDTLEKINDLPSCITQSLASFNIPETKREFTLSLEFLKSYTQSKDTFTSYRREIERLLHFSWLVLKKTLKMITRNDIRDYLQFVQAPPKSWIATKIVDRFIDDQGIRRANPDWRPFVVKVSKIAKRHGKLPNKNKYQLSNKSIEAIFAILSSFFTFLQQEEYLEINPVTLIRQKKAYIQKQQTRKVTRRLSNLQWLYVINTAETMAKENKEYERTLFLMTAFYLLGLRISELAYSSTHRATMGSFAPDKRGLWWYSTVGKGNKMRDVAVPHELLLALKRYREHLNLPPLPQREESTPLFQKIKGKHGLSTRQIRNLVQIVFNRAIDQLFCAGKQDEAEDLATATVHWLRHTAISTDVEFRPREHIRDDVGHENPATMDKYIDIDRVARHASAQGKRLKPDLKEKKLTKRETT